VIHLKQSEAPLKPETLAAELKALLELGLSPTRFAAREANLQELFLALAERGEVSA